MTTGRPGARTAAGAQRGQGHDLRGGLLRLHSGAILLSYCVKDSTEDCSVCFRRSPDEGQTWGDRVKYRIPEPYTGYTGINNGRLIQLKSGRILLAAYDGWVTGRIIVSFALYSDDDGSTWQKSTDVDVRDVDPNNKYGADEPAVIELKDGRVMMIVRTDLGVIIRGDLQRRRGDLEQARGHPRASSRPTPRPASRASRRPATCCWSGTTTSGPQSAEHRDLQRRRRDVGERPRAGRGRGLVLLHEHHATRTPCC